MSENKATSLKGWCKCKPCQLALITMRYDSGRGISLIKDLDLESQMESQVRGLLSDLMETLLHWWWMSLGNTHPPSTQSTDIWEGVGEKHAPKIEIETKTWEKTLIPIQRLSFNCPGYSLSNKSFFIHQVTLMDSHGRETRQKIPWIKLTLLLENLTGNSVYRGIVNLLDLPKHSSNLPHCTTNVAVAFWTRLEASGGSSKQSM